MAGEVRISVRNLVEFILRSGDIDDRRQGSPENAMQEGSRIHRMIGAVWVRSIRQKWH